MYKTFINHKLVIKVNHLNHIIKLSSTHEILLKFNRTKRIVIQFDNPII